MVFLSMTKEEVKEMLTLYCDVLKRNKNIDIRVEDYILALTNMASHWGKVNKAHTKIPMHNYVFRQKQKRP